MKSARCSYHTTTEFYLAKYQYNNFDQCWLEKKFKLLYRKNNYDQINVQIIYHRYKRQSKWLRWNSFCCYCFILSRWCNEQNFPTRNRQMQRPQNGLSCALGRSQMHQTTQKATFVNRCSIRGQRSFIIEIPILHKSAVGFTCNGSISHSIHNCIIKQIIIFMVQICHTVRHVV